MDFFTSKYARSVGKAESYSQSARVLKEEAAQYNKSGTYDVFLSHAFSDADLVLGAKKILEERGFTVYVDWIEDSDIDRSKVTKEIAEQIRQRMKSCKRLVYATSENASKSKWMPWELGYFDGHKPGQVYILPLVENPSDDFQGQEYLSLYPVIGKGFELTALTSTLNRNLQVRDGNSTRYFQPAA
jgi:hypothetical protein